MTTLWEQMDQILGGQGEGQREELQNTINRVVEWSLEWQMIFMGGAALEVVKYERDLGVKVHRSQGKWNPGPAAVQGCLLPGQDPFHPSLKGVCAYGS